jgi:hypothetical protein
MASASGFFGYILVGKRKTEHHQLSCKSTRQQFLDNLDPSAPAVRRQHLKLRKHNWLNVPSGALPRWSELK